LSSTESVKLKPETEWGTISGFPFPQPPNLVHRRDKPRRAQRQAGCPSHRIAQSRLLSAQLPCRSSPALGVCQGGPRNREGHEHARTGFAGSRGPPTAAPGRRSPNPASAGFGDWGGRVSLPLVSEPLGRFRTVPPLFPFLTHSAAISSDWCLIQVIASKGVTILLGKSVSFLRRFWPSGMAHFSLGQRYTPQPAATPGAQP